MKATTVARPNASFTRPLHSSVFVSCAQGVDGVLSESLMRRYVYDFTCMHAPYSPHIDKEAQSTIMWRVLSLFGGAGAFRYLPVSGCV
jgi:hypothetical protein